VVFFIYLFIFFFFLQTCWSIWSYPLPIHLLHHPQQFSRWHYQRFGEAWLLLSLWQQRSVRRFSIFQ